jgi:hypothetical protein
MKRGINKRSSILFLTIVAIVLVVAFGSWWGYERIKPKLLNGWTVQATNLYLDAKDKNDTLEYTRALSLINRVIEFGGETSTVDLFKGQVLTALGRYSEARTLYEQIKANDKSAVQAVDELLKALPS